MGHRYKNNGCGGRHNNGVIYRVTKAVGEKLDLKRKWVLFGFIVLIIINFPLAAFLFLLSWFWTDHPGKLETWWSNLKGNFSPNFATANAASASSYREESQSESKQPFDSDPFMDDLQRQFDDLEARAGKMEEHVSSEEYNLRKEFKKMEE